MLSPRIFTSMVSVGAPGMANSTTSLWFSPSAYATVLGATLIRYSDILVPSFKNRSYSGFRAQWRSEEHTSELQSQSNLVCRLLLEKKKKPHEPHLCPTELKHHPA